MNLGFHIPLKEINGELMIFKGHLMLVETCDISSAYRFFGSKHVPDNLNKRKYIYVCNLYYFLT